MYSISPLGHLEPEREREGGEGGVSEGGREGGREGRREHQTVLLHEKFIHVCITINIQKSA